MFSWLTYLFYGHQYDNQFEKDYEGQKLGDSKPGDGLPAEFKGEDKFPVSGIQKRFELQSLVKLLVALLGVLLVFKWIK